MTYGSETRPLLVDVGLKFEKAEMQMIRWMCGISLKDRRTNEECTKRIQPARGWCATVDCATVQIVSTYPASPEARPPSLLGKPAVRPRSMAGGAPTPCGIH